MKEKPLSSKVMHHRLWAKDVKQAVEKLKNELIRFPYEYDAIPRMDIIPLINKIFGEFE